MLSKCIRFLRPDTLPNVRSFSAVPAHKETTLKVHDLDIKYIETTECNDGAHPVFILPGAFGSIEIDIKPILSHFNTKKYKWISWDPPAFQQTQPPLRDFYSNVYFRDVKYALELMKVLGIPRYSVIAWSGAGITGIMTAAEDHEKVASLITWAAFGYISESMIDSLKNCKKLGSTIIPEWRRKQLVGMYGEENLRYMWDGWSDQAVAMAYLDICRQDGPFKKVIQSVKCPGLMIHGMKDNLVIVDQGKYISDNLKDARLHPIENGTHNLHLKETKAFSAAIHDFLDNKIMKGS